MAALSFAAPMATKASAKLSSKSFNGGNRAVSLGRPSAKAIAARRSVMIFASQTGTKLGVIGGSNLTDSDLFAHLDRTVVDTEYGKVHVYNCKDDDDRQICFVRRHYCGEGESYVPPHCVNAQAIITAFEKLGVNRVLAVCSVGSMRKHIPPHTICFPDDYVALWNQSTFATDSKIGELLPVFDEQGRQAAIAAARHHGIDREMKLWPEDAVYVQTRGPRFETRAEIRALATMGCDVVGMTGVSEVVLCNEKRIPITMVAFCDNYANGVGGEADAYSEFYSNVGKNTNVVERMVDVAIDALLEPALPPDAHAAEVEANDPFGKKKTVAFN